MLNCAIAQARELQYSLQGQDGVAKADADSIFRDASQAAGLRFVHFNGMHGDLHYPEILGSGGALFDFDNDGDLDLYVVQGAALGAKPPSEALIPWKGEVPPIDRLYRNDLRDGKVHLVDVTSSSGIVSAGYGMGAAAGDFNNDGWIDLYVTNWGPNQLFLNNGDGTFRDATEEWNAGDSGWGSSAVVFDFDQDGWLDIFIVNYVVFSLSSPAKCFSKTSAQDYCGPDIFQDQPDRLLRNKGGKGFEDVSLSSGIASRAGAGLGAVAADFNGDGRPDIYVANDGDPNLLWLNQGNGRFKEDALLAGLALNGSGAAEAGMGVDAGDFDGDGDDDLFLTHLMEETNTLYVNLGDGFFEDGTIQAGLHVPSLKFTAFGTGWLDFDNDGWLDLFAMNGAVRLQEELARKGDPYPLDQPNQLFRNTGKGGFVDVTSQAGSGFLRAEVSRGGVPGDIDNDGDTDLVIFNNSGPARLLLNQVGNRKNWIGLRLAAGTPPRDMLGSTALVSLGNGRKLHRRFSNDGGYCTSRDPRILAGLDDWSDPVDVKVTWPDGASETWKGLKVNRYWTLIKGQSSASRSGL